jgi:hypothetical protein
MTGDTVAYATAGGFTGSGPGRGDGNAGLSVSWLRRAATILAVVALVLAAGAGSARASISVVGSGDLPSAVTDQDGTTHLVWLESHPSGADTIGYCRISRGATTCADLKHLTPTCEGGGTAAWQHRIAGGDLDGDRPKVMISPFGDVFIVAHGLCSINWGSTRDPWAQWHAINREILLQSDDGGDTFTSSSGQARAKSSRKTTADVDSGDTSVSSSVYDAVNSRVVSVEYAPGDTQALDQFGSNDGVTAGIIALGRQDQLGVNDPNPPSVAQMEKGVLAATYVNNQQHVSGGAPSLVQRGPGSFAVAYQGNGFQPILLRTFDCVSCPTTAISDAANWGAEFTLPAEDQVSGGTEGAHAPKLVTGPAGTFLFYRNSTSGNNPTTRYWVRKLDGNTLGDRHLALSVPLGNFSQTNVQADFAENRSTGRLTAVSTSNPTDSTTAPAAVYATSDDAGLTWTAATQVATYPVNTGNVYAVGTDTLSVSTGDFGFTGLLIRTGTAPDSSVPDRPIYVDPLPGSGESPPPGDGGGGGGGGGTGSGSGSTGGGGSGGSPSPTPSPTPTTDACKVKQFGPLDIVADACLEIDPKTGAVTARGHVKVSGLELAGASITFDAQARTVTSTGPVTFSAGDTELFRTKIDWKLPAGNIFTLPSIDVGSLAGKLEGFPVKGSADVKLIRGGVEIPLHLALPSLFGGVTGDVTLRADNLAGIHLKALNVSVAKALIGPLELDDMHFSYDPDEHNWDGGATLKLPPTPPSPALAADVGFTGGEFDHASGELTFPGEGLPIDGFDLTHITKIRFSLAVKPDLKLGGGVTFTAGPKYGDYHVAQIDGDMSFTFPSGQPAILRADGTLQLLTIPVATAYMQFKTDGQVNFGGHIDLAHGDFGLHAGIDGWILPPKAFSVYGKASVCLGDLGCASGEAVVSSVGLAACAHVLGVDFGAGYKWGPSALWVPAILADIDYMFTGCSVSEYQPAAPPIGSASAAGRPRAVAAAAERSFEVGAGLPFMVVSAVGATAPPHVTLSGPGGTQIVSAASGPDRTSRTLAFHVNDKKTTFFVVRNPAAGRWQITPLPDSSPVVSAGHGNGLPAPSIHGRVTGHGAKRTFTYRVKPLPGQTVSFEEHGRSGSGFLGQARHANGRLRFTPANGSREKRTIVALVNSFGKPRGQYPVTSYRSPGPQRPATPKAFKITRKGTRLRVSWKRTGVVSRYILRVRLSDGRVLLLLPKARQTSATVADVSKKVKATATLQGQNSLGVVGRSATARLRR